MDNTQKLPQVQLASREYSCGETIAALALLPLMTLFYAVINGYVFMTLWNWFVPHLFSFPSLTLIEAIGVIVIIGFLTSNTREDPMQAQKSMMERVIFEIITSLLRAGLYLLIGFVAHQIMGS